MFPLTVKSSRPRNRCHSYLAMLLRLDMSIVREILNREELPGAETSGQQRGVAVGQAPAGLLNACSRLMELLDTPEDIPFLGHLVQREIIYHILKTPQGARLRTIATTGDLGNRTARDTGPRGFRDTF